MTLNFHLKISRLGYSHGTSALYRSPVSDCVQRRLTCFPGQGFQCLPRLTGPGPELDSSSTGGVFCVSDRIPALSVSDVLHHTHWIGVFAFVHDIAAMNGQDPKGIPSVRLPGGMSRMFDSTLHRAAETAGSITGSFKPFCPFSRYRPELRTCSAIEKIWPADGQRLPSAYPAAFAACLKKDWLPPLFTDLPAIVLIITIQGKQALFSIPLLRSASILYTPFRASLETGVSVIPKTTEYHFRPPSCRHHPAAFRVIPFFRKGVY